MSRDEADGTRTKKAKVPILESGSTFNKKAKKTRTKTKFSDKHEATRTYEMVSQQMSLKLLVHRKGPRVLFAEASKEFVDFLFYIFSLPLGTLIELLGSTQMVGCLGKLKDSIDIFQENYLEPGIKLDEILNPKSASDGNKFLLSYDCSSKDQDQSGASNITVYTCSNPKEKFSKHKGTTQHCRSYVTLHEDSECPSCKGSMNVQLTVVMPNEVAQTNEANKKMNGGYVKEVVTYMVMDDLEVKPMSTISSITLINKFGVKDLSQLEEKTVSFGKDEGLKLLMASLKTDKVLTTIFMHALGCSYD